MPLRFRGAKKKKKKSKKPVGDTPLQEMSDSSPAEPSPEPEPQPEADAEDADDAEELSPEEIEVRSPVLVASHRRACALL